MPLFRINPGGRQEALSVPFQQTALFFKEHRDLVTPEEEALTDKIIQKTGNAVGNIVWAYDSLFAAESKYHSVLAAAAVSSVDVHSAALLNESGLCIKHESYDHTPEPELEE